MPTADLYKSTLWSDGEGLTHGDMNDGIQWALSRLVDQLLEHQTGGPLATAAKEWDQWTLNGGDQDVRSLVFTLTGGEAVLYSTGGGGGKELGVGPGTIFQKVADATGTAPAFLAYSLAGATFTISNGDATNPRIDIVQVKLESVDGDAADRDFKDAVTGALTTASTNKTRRIQATISVKEGTPAATPTYPTPDAGYAVLGAVRVDATWTGIGQGVLANYAGNVDPGALIRQCSIPLGVQGVMSHPHEWDLGVATAWERDGTHGHMIANGASTNLMIWCPVATGNRRIVGVALRGKFVATGSVELEAAQWLDSSTDYEVVEALDLSASLVNVGTFGTLNAHIGKLADASGDSNPTAANGPIGDPFWACGGKAGPANRPLSVVDSGGPARARLRIDGGNTSYLTEAIWFLAG